MNNILPPEVISVIEQFLRDMNRLHCGVFGLAYQTEPEPGMALLRTSEGDVVSQAESVLRIVKRAKTSGRVIDQEILPLN